MFRKSLIALLLAASCVSVQAADQLSIGKHRVQFGNGVKSIEYKISGSDLKRLSVSMPSNRDLDMQIKFGTKAKQAVAVNDLYNDCAPFNGPGKTEECLLNLNKTSSSQPFYLLISNTSTDNTPFEAVIRYYDYSCRPYLYKTRSVLRLCPVVEAQERHKYSESEDYRWKRNLDNSHHTGGDINARDINWSTGDTDLNKRLYAGFGGKVISSVERGSYGLSVIIYNEQFDVAIRYAHLASTSLNVGDEVNTSDYVGQLGDSSTFTMPAHLHLAVYRNIKKTTDDVVRTNTYFYDSLVNGTTPSTIDSATYAFSSRYEFDQRN